VTVLPIPIAVSLIIAQALLLLLGYVLYRKAKRDLSARAAETPVLSEISSLQRNVKDLLGAMEEASEETNALASCMSWKRHWGHPIAWKGRHSSPPLKQIRLPTRSSLMKRLPCPYSKPFTVQRAM
jgi:hypothetical protein